MDSLQLKHDLFVKLGALFGPVRRLIEHPAQYDAQDKAEALARYCAEMSIICAEFDSFSKNQPGHLYAIQNQQFSNAIYSVQSRLTHESDNLANVITESFSKAKAAIDAIPIPRTSVILEAGSPFTAYCRLHELCAVDATVSLTWLDPYLDASVFHRYVSNVRPQVPVTLVTSEPGANASSGDKRRWTEFLDISRLFGIERGPAGYRLVVQANLHDRWVVFDDKRIYSLGGSVKDAASRDYFTIAAVEASLTNMQAIQAHITSGIEFFGPNIRNHR